MKPGSRKVYVFLTKRPVDSEEWPNAYSELSGQTTTGLERAEAALGRVTPVVTVDFDAEVATPEQRAELAAGVAQLRATYDATLEMERMGPANPLATICGALLDMVEQLLEGTIKL